jgi:DNA-binding MarR family transcriptional regulator
MSAISKNDKLSDLERRELGLRNWPDVVGNSTGIVRQMLTAVERMKLIFGPRIAAHGIQPGDFDVMVTLRIFGAPYELSPTALYRARCLSSGGLTKILHRLEDAGMVKRHDNPDDKRSQLIRLTAKGKRVVEATMKDIAQLEAGILAEFKEADLRQLSALLSLMARGVDRAGGDQP